MIVMLLSLHSQAAEEKNGFLIFKWDTHPDINTYAHRHTDTH